jgi:intracellular septation protein
MRDFLNAAKLLVADLASTLFFAVLFLLTHSIILSVSLGMALGVVQLGTHFVRQKPVHTMQWLSLLLTIGAGITTLLTSDPRFVMFKPSVIYAIAGVVMLKRGWPITYLPAIAKAVAPDVAVVVGFAWAGLMFVSAAANTLVALTYGVQTWASTMLIFGIVSKGAMFLCGFISIRVIVVRRVRAMPVSERDALLVSTGRG